MTKRSLKTALRAKEFILAPGIFDLISALIADRQNVNALYVTGYGTVASYLGLPDAGLATYRDMVERVAQMVRMTTKPVIADADTGYGGLLNVRHTVQGYEDAGVAAMQIEDQEFPKKCGHTPNRRVISLEDMARKIEVAAATRRSDDFLIIARTDARTSLGIDEAIRRGQAYAKAGADIVFIESPESREEMLKVAEAIPGVPLMANMVNGGRTPLFSAAELAEMGYLVAIHPAIGFLSIGAALQNAYSDLARNGISSADIDLYPFEEFNKLLGFDDVWAFEKKYAQV